MRIRTALRGLVAALLAIAALLAASSGTAQAAGPDASVDWTIATTFIGPQGEDAPLRVGKHDVPGGRDGFGVRHIIDGHGEVPDYADIQGALEHPTQPCSYQAANDRWECLGDTGSNRGVVFVYFTERIDGASGDDRPVGIITSYYAPRGCPC